MKLAIFDTKEYDKEYFTKVNKGRHEITFFEDDLTSSTAALAKGFDGVSGFVNTECNNKLLTALHENGVKFWFQRSMGYNRVDLARAKELDIQVYRVPNYSAESVSEYAMTLLMATNRKIIQANAWTSAGKFTLDGLQGKAIFGSTTGVIGAGKIGQGFIKIMTGMGSKVLVLDEFAQKNFPETANKLGFEYVTKEELLINADFISLHAPLLPSTKHIINAEAISQMKDGVIIINTARGPLIDTTALINGIKSGKIGAVGLDVLERETGRFFHDRSSDIDGIKANDSEWKFLLESNKVLVTAHQAFFTTIALTQIAEITLKNVDDAQNNDFSKALKLQDNGKVLNG